MAVRVDFLGPMAVRAETRIATISGVEKSRFTAWMAGTPATANGEATLECRILIRGGDGTEREETAARTERYTDGGGIWIGVALDCRAYADCEVQLYATGNLRADAAGITGYERRDLPDRDTDGRRRGIVFDIRRLVPKYLLGDRNGYALARAIERAFQLAAEGAQYGIDIIQDPYKMPEWRLDERAGELGCLYDYNGTIEQKRYWILNATYLYKVYGTPQAIYNFLEGYFQTVLVEENWEYGGEPYHFRVTVSGSDYDAGKIAWAQKAIQNVKNVRSILDAVTIDSSSEIVVSADTEYFYVQYPYAAEEDQTAAGDLTEYGWEEEMPIAAGVTDEAVTDSDVVG